MNPSISPEKQFGRKGKLDTYFLLILLALSLCLNVALGWKVQELDRLERLVASLPKPRELPVGMDLAPITVSNLDAKPGVIVFEDDALPTVLYVFQPDCEWCARNIENIKVFADLKGESYRVIGLSLTSSQLKDYIGTHSFSFPVYTIMSPEATRTLSLGRTPQTIVVSPEGKVLKNWVGAYGGTVQLEIEDYFGIQLPGLTVESPVD